MNQRRASLTSPLERAFKQAQAFALRPFARLSPATREVIGFCVLVAATMLLLARPAQQTAFETYNEGDVVRRTVTAPSDLRVPDEAETERRRQKARETQLPVFIYDATAGETAVKKFRDAWLTLQRQKGEGKKPEWTAAGGSPALVAAVAAHGFSGDALERTQRIMGDVAERQIYDDAEARYMGQDIALEDARNAQSHAIVAMPQTRLMPRSQVADRLRERLTQLSGWSITQQNALADAMNALVTANVRYSPEATAAAREDAARRIEPAAISLKRNQVIAREGDTVTPNMLAQLQVVSANTRGQRTLHHIFGLLFIVSGLYWTAWQYVRRRVAANVALPLSAKRAFTLVALSVLVQVALLRVGFLLAESLTLYAWKPWGEDYALWSLAIPFASGALLVALLLDAQLGFITGLLTALFAAMLAPRNAALALGLYALLSCAAAIYGIKRYRERQSVTLAGLVAGGINGLTAIALMSYNQQPLVLRTALLALGCGLVGGLLTIIFTSGGLPINESLFGILTDVKLLELSNADLPILSQMAVQTPGTNQHSHGVGQLTEEACRAIGANALLARIGALYHDIGKLGSPLHFIENQNGDNPHDKLKPLQSAKIISNHVTYGLKLAEDIGLPKRVADFIPQHHGTRTLHYFYRKALAAAGPGETVNEADFRYPGPKPQFKEPAIMMIADSCEAAARSLAQPTPENIRAIVGKIVQAIQEDGQLDECGLTLRELKLIQDSIVGSLVALYHTRVTYPGFNPPDGDKPLPAAELDAEERELEGRPARKKTKSRAAS
jgi:hypothetical protein